MEQDFYDKYEYLRDACRNCGKLKSANDIYFCSGCGFGKFEDLQFAWEEVTLRATLQK